MKFNAKITSALLLVAAVACSVDPEFNDLEGTMISQARSKSGNYLVVSTSMSSRVYFNSNESFEQVSELAFYFEDKRSDAVINPIRGYALKSAISDDGILVVNILGVALEAWKIDVATKSASKIWTIENPISSSPEILESQSKLLLVNSKSFKTIDLSSGKVLMETKMDGLVRIMETQDNKLIFQTRDAIFTLPSIMFELENLQKLSAVIQDTIQGLTNNPKISYTGRSLMFPLHGLKENS